MTMRRFAVPCFAFLLAISSSALGGEDTAAAPKSIPEGLWGGAGAEMKVGASEVLIEFDCGKARMPAPIPVDKDGQFTATVSYEFEGGPTVQNPTYDGEAMTIAGKLNGRTITLRLVDQRSKKTEGKWTLQSGERGKLRKCD